MMRTFVFLIVLMAVSSFSYAQSLEELRKQREKTQKDIQYTNQLLKKAEKDAKASLNQITIINKQISNRRSLISTINQELQLLDAEIVEKTNNIYVLENQLEDLKKEYEKAVFHTWKTRSSQNRLMYVFSGQDIGEVYRRARYLHEFSSFRKQQGNMILTMQKDILKELSNVKKQRDEKIGLLDSKTQEQYSLQQEQSKQDSYVKKLQKEQQSLTKQLAQQQKKMNELNKVIERIIAEEIRKANEGKKDVKAGEFKLTPEEKIVSDQFDKNRGKLPWPVTEGIIISKYGVHRHEIETKVTIDNPGIDIQTTENANARAVFEGTVTGVYPLPGYNLGVIIRHGEYLTFYANLSDVYVKKGDNVDIKQDIGKVYTDEFNGKTFLHFEVWKGSVKNNPEYWISR